jgi:nucleotide-binding universal stress UspA family protein
MGTIVVGVDGSEGSLHALRFAADEARLRDAQLRVVLAWEYPVSLFAGVGYTVPDAVMLSDFHELAEKRLAEALEAVAPALEGVEVERSVVEGAPSPALLEAAKGADLLVVGTRGHGGFVGLLLGSVSQQCAHHAPCPVTIVPSAERG